MEKRTITVWLMTVIRQLVEETEKTIAKVGQFGRTFTSVDDRSSIRWKLGEDELSAALYLMDISNDLVLAVKFLLWLLPKVSSPSSTFHSGRNILLLPKNVESQVCEVGEAFLISSLRRYENVVIATDLIPEVLSAIMHRASAVVASNGRLSGSPALAYSRYLSKRYVMWLVSLNGRRISRQHVIRDFFLNSSLDNQWMESWGFHLVFQQGLKILMIFSAKRLVVSGCPGRV
ncbi:mediator of RNA polymerase II transcription subunit 12 isoform X2 [Prunus yedoensis var. nudiflora]|uniref:Mediator of RNA polymerase II transcription subunit 12 isoform X2 n=1 Tax=Prunus yedoensis var. nudiflora TaxID=2094558 RepID=A0A314YB59_PRUYE|nr:mediator of RNA polymerase II transcription subunit 12 isoform X2 [Prunus yedoensis var. nudiflora]